MIFALGWLGVRQIDISLNEKQIVKTKTNKSDINLLRIGLSNPLVADSLSTALESYSKQNSKAAIYIFYGNADELLKKMDINKLDVIFLPEEANIPYENNYKKKKVILKVVPVIMKYGGFPIEPIREGSITQNIVWKDEFGSPSADFFIKYIDNMYTA